VDVLDIVSILESHCLADFVGVMTFERGKRYIFNLNGVSIHLIIKRGSSFIEVWPEDYAVPLYVIEVSSVDVARYMCDVVSMVWGDKARTHRYLYKIPLR